MLLDVSELLVNFLDVLRQWFSSINWRTTIIWAFVHIAGMSMYRLAG
jgi:hypothetical protein